MRFCLCLIAVAALCLAADSRPGATIRGKLIVRDGQPTVLETAGHKRVKLEADDNTTKVLNDPRIDGFEAEIKGRFAAPDRFVVDPPHTHPMLVAKDGHMKLVSYWCDICTIRSYAPGPCVCCQKDTTLDLIDPSHKDLHQ
jgi:hypothetical protein